MSGNPKLDRRALRRQESKAEILRAAWETVRENGLASLSMRDLGTRVGMRAQSLYSYFASKHDIYDAMFHQGYEAFSKWMDDALDDDEVDRDPIVGARRIAHSYLEFCTSDPARYQLLFQRTIPDFEPSPESWALALHAYERLRERLNLIGVHDQASLDLWTAVMTGLVDQQISNDPGGDRWKQLCDRSVDMLLADGRAHDHAKRDEPMTTVNTTDADTIPPIGHAEAMELQTTEFHRSLEVLRGLAPEHWSMQTPCPDWDVRRMWLHVLGASEASASIRENIHQMRLARKRRRNDGVSLEAGLSAVQVEERADLAPDELVHRLERIAPKAVKGRRRTPAPMRAMKVAVDAPVVEKWSLGYLIDIIYLRDVWMHRIDTTRCTGTELVLNAEHDGRIVADVVAEWARRHGRPFHLELTGAAGGVFMSGSDGDHITTDAVEFCCLLAGRGEPTGLLATVVPF